jgi:cytoskeletal protein CcmA (bactofilin family)
VKADLDVGSANIAGRVEGRVYAKERVELQTASHLKGDVHAKSFVIQDGCFFQGNCSMGEAHQPSSRPSFVDNSNEDTEARKKAA